MTKEKIGMFYGVLVPNITMMLGVILFLRLGVLVGYAGIFQMVAVILVALALMIVTSLSIASIATNMRMGGGGVYYLITRSLGIEIGGTVGLALYISQIISITLTVTGFSYTLCDLYPQFNIIVVEASTLFSLGLLSGFSSKMALKLQLFILMILLLGVGSVFLGSMGNVEPAHDFTPVFSQGTLGFWETFAYFYPALTGIEAGMAMSGILKRPGRSLFIGNIGGLLFAAGLYLAISAFAYINIPKMYLMSNPFIFVSFAKSEWLVTLGILTATLSSALGSILGAPRILESMSNDGLVPSIFSRVYGAYKEPRWALFLTVSLALITALLTDIDQIIPILTMICLITYGLLNLVAGLSELMNTASWRPVVRTPWWLSILGFLTAMMMMLFINVTWTFIALALFITFFLLIQGRNLEAGFQDLRDSMVFFFSRTALYHLGAPAKHALVWHPQLLVIATAVSQQRKLAHLAHHLTHRSGLLTFAAIVPTSWQDPEQIESSKSSLKLHLEKEGVSGLVEILPAESKLEGQLNLIRAYGIGAIQPNTIVLPFSLDGDFLSLFEVIGACRLMRKNLVLFSDSQKTDEEKYIKGGHKKMVDLWWNGDDRKSFALSVSLTTTLRDNRVWANGDYHLRAIVSSRSAKSVLQKFFKEYVLKSRLPFKPLIHFEPKIKDYISHISHYSSEADLTIICIRAYDEEEEPATYIKYLQQLFNETKDLNDCLYVCSYDGIEHKKIYHS